MVITITAVIMQTTTAITTETITITGIITGVTTGLTQVTDPISLIIAPGITRETMTGFLHQPVRTG
jgi:hypothetical protein